LRQEGLASKSDLLGAQAKAEAQQGQAQALRAEQRQVSTDRQVRLGDRGATLARLERERVEGLGRGRACEVALARLEQEVELRAVRAPVDGVIREFTPTPEGSQVASGHRFALVVPGAEPRIIAEFEASQAVGRLRPGQPARLRLQAFPWTRHGVVEARVRSAATEPRGGLVRVELTPLRVPPSIHLEHGLHGTLEVITELATPLDLLLRMAGQAIIPQAPTGGATAAPR
jgi:membrane fusion protein (multidrug efflux system)